MGRGTRGGGRVGANPRIILLGIVRCIEGFDLEVHMRDGVKERVWIRDSMIFV